MVTHNQNTNVFTPLPAPKRDVLVQYQPSSSSQTMSSSRNQGLRRSQAVPDLRGNSQPSSSTQAMSSSQGQHLRHSSAIRDLRGSTHLVPGREEIEAQREREIQAQHERELRVQREREIKARRQQVIQAVEDEYRDRIADVQESLNRANDKAEKEKGTEREQWYIDEARRCMDAMERLTKKKDRVVMERLGVRYED
ncbi:MAG: hypothetical protein Q9220_001794 [cf. Caloplaca sp. 1 TL-2023]